MAGTPEHDDTGDHEPGGTDLAALDELLDGVPLDDRAGPDERRVTVRSATSFSGPLPPPNILREYDEVSPGLAREIVDLLKAETTHRHQTIDDLRTTDREAMRLFYAGEKRGQILAFALMALVLAVAAYAISEGSEVAGIAAVISAAAPVAWAMRRRSDAPPEVADLADGDKLESSPRND